MTQLPISINKRKIAACCKKYHITYLALFRSILTSHYGQPSEVLQQAELPEIKASITEYLLQKYGCNECGKNSTASLPPGIPDSAFGPKLMGLLATLTGVLHVAKREAIQLIKDLTGLIAIAALLRFDG